MKYVCQICGYIFDEEKENQKFTDLPEDWKCPWCGAAKSDFAPEKQAEPGQEVKEIKKAAEPAPVNTVEADLQKLSIAEVSAVCSNLARGCEKQYRAEESALFQELADYFAAITPDIAEADVSYIAEAVRRNIDSDYETVRTAAEKEGDRGTQRICVWGEKVTRMLNSLITRYEKEGESFLAGTDIWVCTTCGFIYVGDTPPQLCPVCKVPDWKFEKVERR